MTNHEEVSRAPPICSSVYLPDRMFWKAASTLEASNADVSIKDRLFSAEFADHFVFSFCDRTIDFL